MNLRISKEMLLRHNLTSLHEGIVVLMVEGFHWSEGEQLSVVFHSTKPSEAVRQRGEVLLRRLLQASPSIMKGTMTIEGRHRHHQQGNIFHVALRFHLPGADIVVSHDPEKNHAHEDVYVAMRDACEAARKQLEAYEERRGGKGAQHETERYEHRPE